MKGSIFMFALYYKELYIVKEPLTKNCTCQSWRAKQLAICEEIEPLKNYINNQNDIKVIRSGSQQGSTPCGGFSFWANFNIKECWKYGNFSNCTPRNWRKI